MQKYSLDTNVFIQAHRTVYPMDVFPAFWDWLGAKLGEGTIFCTSFVYDEIKVQEDDLADWFKKRKTSGLCITPDEETTNHYTDITNHVDKLYGAANPEGRKFLEGADGWVIAAAISEQAIVVTEEKPVRPPSPKVKIPNVCDELNVDWIDTIRLLRQLGAKFI
jgi:hypothetical protein